MNLFISNKRNVIDDIKNLEGRIALISIDSPYPDAIDLSPVIRSNRFIAVLKLFFYDSDDKAMNDSRLIFNTGMRDAAIHFIEAMLALDIDVCAIICEKGLHRSVALCEGLRQVFARRGIDLQILNYPERAEPNTWVLGYFGEESKTIIQEDDNECNE